MRGSKGLEGGVGGGRERGWHGCSRLAVVASKSPSPCLLNKCQSSEFCGIFLLDSSIPGSPTGRGEDKHTVPQDRGGSTCDMFHDMFVY
jgi:hypothetical protein